MAKRQSSKQGAKYKVNIFHQRRRDRRSPLSVCYAAGLRCSSRKRSHTGTCVNQMLDA